MKDLKNLKGAKELSKQEQRSINGGVRKVCEGCHPNDNCCINGMCGRIGWDGQCYLV